MEEKLQEISRLYIEVTQKSLTYWQIYNWNTWQFWLTVALFLIPLILWWRLVDKERIFEIALFGFIVNTVNLYLDAYGVHYGLWIYKYELLPTLATNFGLNYSVVPVSFMLIYQYAGTLKKYLLFLFGLAIIMAYPMQLLVKWINIYEDYRWWNSNYSFLTLLFIGLSSKGVITLFKKVKI